MEKLNRRAEPASETDALDEAFAEPDDAEDADKDLEDLAQLQITQNILSGDPFGWFPK